MCESVAALGSCVDVVTSLRACWSCLCVWSVCMVCVCTRQRQQRDRSATFRATCTCTPPWRLPLHLTHTHAQPQDCARTAIAGRHQRGRAGAGRGDEGASDVSGWRANAVGFVAHRQLQPLENKNPVIVPEGAAREAPGAGSGGAGGDGRGDGELGKILHQLRQLKVRA